MLAWNSGSGVWEPRTVTTSGSGGGSTMVKRSTDGNLIILSGYSLIVAQIFEVSLGDTLEIQEDGILEVT